MPVAVLVAVLVDVARPRAGWVASRVTVLCLYYLTVDLLAVALLGLAWLVSGCGLIRRLDQALAFAIQRAWAVAMFGAVRRVFRLKLDVRGLEEVGDTPLILLLRHTSIVDTLLAVRLITCARGLHLRYVIKSELRIDPAIDIAGHRLGNSFVERGSGDTAVQVERILQMARRTGADEGLAIYPEGTRFTRARQQAVFDSLARRDPERLAYAQSLQHVLPPRPAGTHALLRGAPDADLVILANVGTEGRSSIAEIIDSIDEPHPITVHATRHDRSSVPEDPDDFAGWLVDRWLEMDDWIHARVLERDHGTTVDAR